MGRVGWDDYYTTWSFALLVVAQVTYLVFRKSQDARLLFDAACVNSLMIGLIGACVACVIPSFEDEHQCRKRRMPLNALLHAAPAAYATLVLLYRPIRSRISDICVITTVFATFYIMWPSTSGTRGVDKVRWAYGVKRPYFWLGASALTFLLFGAASKLGRRKSADNVPFP